MPSAASVAAVTQDYTIELLRTGSTTDINSWASEIDASLLTAAQVATAIGASLEANTFVLPIEQVYAGLFGRVGDAGGLNVWVNALRNGATFNSVIQSFVSSQEFTNKYGAPASVNATAFVTALYTNILGRSPDAGGLAAWTSVLSTVNVANLAAVIQGIVSSAEALKDDTGPIDLYLAAAGVAGTYASSIAGIFGPAGTASSNPGLTYTLTTGIDAAGTGAFSAANGGAITGNNNTIFGTFNGSTAAPATFTAGDSIVGPAGATGNTLTLSDVGGAPTAESAVSNATTVAATVSNIQTLNIVAGQAVFANTASGTPSFSGLTQLNVNDNAGSTITAAATTSVTVTDSAQGTANADGVTGGLNIIVNASGVTGAGGSITVGATTAPAGTIAVTESVAAGAATYVADLITVTGGAGTTIAVTANLSETGGANTVTGNTIAITGGSGTATVTVNQSAAITGAAAITAVTGVPATVGATAAAPGINAVTATTAAQAVAAVAAVAGVLDGAVQITDAGFGGGATGTIATASLSNYGTSFIKSNALQNLTVSATGQGGVGSVTAPPTVLTVTRAATAANTGLALTVNGSTANKASLSSTGTQFSISDANAEVTTLNVTTGTAGSNLTFTDAALTKLNVAGTQVLALGALNAGLTTIAVSGSAGFNDNAAATTGLQSLGAALTSFTTTSSGKITATLDDTTQTFVGSSGQDVITVTKDASKAITGGSATTNEIIFNAAAATFNATAPHITNTNITGFTTFGTGAGSSGTFDLSTYNSGFNKVDVSAAATVSFVKVATGAALNIAKTGSTVSLAYSDTTGPTDATSLSLASATNTLAFTVASLTLSDANLVGVGTLNVSSLGTDLGFAGTGGALTTIAALVDQGLNTLTVTGGAGLTVATLNESLTQAVSFTMTSNETGENGTTIGTFTDANLGTLAFAGTNTGTITAMIDSAAVLSISNSGAQTATINTLTDNTLTSLTLGANVAVGPIVVTTVPTVGIQDSSAAGVTISGSADNSHVTVVLSGGAASGLTDNITLGNGNDYVNDASAATTATVNITVGTGSNFLVLGGVVGAATALDSVFNVNLGAHTLGTGPDVVTVFTGGAKFATVANDTITGAVIGDKIIFGADTSSSNAALTATPSGASAALTITAIEAAASAIGGHGVAFGTFGGNTYVAETVSGTLAANDTTIIQLIGTHTFTPSTGFLTLLT